MGDEPSGLVVSTERRQAFVALGGEDVVAVLDLAKLLFTDDSAKAAIASRLEVGGIPRTLGALAGPAAGW